MKKLILLFTVITLMLPLNQIKSNIINVPSNYSTIQSAINAASSGDTILVSPGTYYENINYRGKNIVLTSYYIFNHDTSYINNTIINGSTPAFPDSASCVMMTTSSISTAGDSTAALLGFTITGGHGIVWSDIHEPGLFYREGGGIFIQYWSPRIKYNRIIINTILDTQHPNGGGGGIRCGDGNPLIENNVIQCNFGYCGMGINLYYSSAILRNNIFEGNYGGRIWGSGVIYTYKNYLTKPVIIENNTIVNNSALNGCGGVRIYLTNNVTLKNNIIWGNIPMQIYLTGGTTEIFYCDIQEGSGGTGNINLYPQFENNSYYLSQSSPCKDAGDTSVIYNDPEDPGHPGSALWPALGTIRNDMGAFGGPNSMLIGTAPVGIMKGKETTNPDYHLYQNYPNPFNPFTMIKFIIKESGLVRLKVYDILGKEISTLVNEELTPGEYNIPFSIDKLSKINISSGVYFYKITTKNFTDVKKMVILK